MNPSNLFTSSSELHDSLRLIRRGMLFGLPFIFALVFIVLVDPFNYLKLFSVFSSDIKMAVSPELNFCFWKMNEFERDPHDSILLGDSRMMGVKSDFVHDVTGETFSNMAYGGGTLREAIDTFWFAVEKTKLRKVFMGINLNNYNDYDISNRTRMYSSINENPALYFVNRTVWESAFYVAYKQLTKSSRRLGVPTMDRESFWQYELDIMRLSYSRYSPPKKYRQEIQKISEYCRQNNIELTFVIFPTHVEEQELIVEAHLESQNRAMREDLRTLGKVLDFQYDNEITREKANYDDPIHLGVRPLRILVKEVWGNELKFGQKLN